MAERMVVYHGTIEKSVESIIEKGFYIGSYFSPFLDTALSQGGPHIFAVLWDGITNPKKQWEVINRGHIPASEILYYQKFSYKLEYINHKAIINWRREQLAVECKTMCENCSGLGEIIPNKQSYRYLREPGGASFRHESESVICQFCKGYGHEGYGTCRASLDV